VTDYTADVVVVGAGVAGMLAAWKLAEAGASVIALESGPRVERSEALQTYRAAVEKTPGSPYPSVPYAPHPDVDALEDYYVQDGPTLFKSTYTRRVGGTTWHWLGTALRHLPNDFQLLARYGVGADWPLRYDDLEPWYLAAEQALGVAGDSTVDLGSPRSGDYPMRALPPTYLNAQLALTLQPLGIAVHVTPQARNSRFFDDRPPCCGNATCVPICPIGAKYDAATHARKFEALGGQLLDQAIATFVEVDGEGRISRVRFKRPDGSEHSVTGQFFVIAANAIETPKLLFMSRADGLPNGVANRSDQVGRNLMDHPIQLSWALADQPLYPYRSPLENAGIEQFRDGDFRRERSAFRVAVGDDGWSFPGTPPPALATALIKEGFRGKQLREELTNRAARQFRFAALVEQLPNPENRVTLADDQRDALGSPRPRIHYDLDDHTRRGLEAARQMHDQIFDAVGVSYREHAPEHFGAGHIMGTYRMGADPATSVVDADQRAHDHPNLFLLGSGVFPTVGTANPTLTIAALALRAAETIRRDLGAQTQGG
jgi:choline dehydrogenase-like flavoprotein